MLYQINMIIVLCVIAPFLTGLLVASITEKSKRSFGTTYVLGMFLLLALFQVVVVPIVILDDYGFQKVVPIYSVILIVCSISGLVVAALKIKKEGSFFRKNQITFKEKQIEEKIAWILLFLMIGFQIYMAITMESFDGDDAFYVVHSLLTVETDTMYRILPYTGLSSGADLRHSLAVFPIWIAYLGKVTGIHTTILAHTVLPIFLIPITYWIYAEVGKVLLIKEKQKLPIYMIFVVLLQLFGNTSIYTNATFFTMRTWQGKAILGNIIIFATIWILLWILEEKKWQYFGILFLINIVAAMASTSSVFLMCFFLGIVSLVIYSKERELSLFFKMIVSCTPCFLYGILYIVL